MQMRPLRDKNRQLLAAGYEPVDGILRLQWKSGLGEHSGVPEEKYLKLCRALYPYRQYQLTIKGQYPYRKIEVEDGRFGNQNRDSSTSSETREGVSRNDESIPAALPFATRGSSQELAGTGHVSRKAGPVMDVYFPSDGMVFHEDGHYYTLKDQRIPFSLTQVIKLAGMARQPQSAQEAEAWAKKAILGTKVHEYTHWLSQGEIELDDLKNYPDYFNRVLGWQQFCDDFKFMPDLTMCEVPIAVKVNGMMFATKVDAYGCIGDENNLAMAVVEKKCSVNIEPHYALQTAGEALCFKAHAEALNMPLKRYLVQLLPEPNGSGKCYRALEHTDRNDERIFVGACLANVYKRLEYGTLKAG